MFKILSRFYPFCIVFGLAVSLLAADPWMAKDYKQWDQKDVAKILGDSPWVKPVLVDKYWRSNSQSGPPTGSQSNSATGDLPTAAFLVRWISSATIHHAVARNAELSQNAAPADAEKYANESSETYDIVVVGPDMFPFGSLDNADSIEQLRQKVYIENKSASLRVAPLKAEVRMNDDGKTPGAVTFHFAKKNADGSPLFAPNLKGVDFVCPAGKIEIKTHFDFTKMVTQQGLDL
jgi:hypothetical protein